MRQYMSELRRAPGTGKHSVSMNQLFLPSLSIYANVSPGNEERETFRAMYSYILVFQ